jgi:hypothetical protein
MKSRGVAENYVHQTLCTEAQKEITTEEELLIDILTFRAEQASWREERKVLEIELAKRAEEQQRFNSQKVQQAQYYPPVQSVNEEEFIHEAEVGVNGTSHSLDVISGENNLDLEDISLLDKIGVMSSDNLIQTPSKMINQSNGNGTVGTPASASNAPDFGDDFITDNFLEMPPTPADMTDDYFNF